jgi:predicted RNA-binding Zn ribbon-like protein
MSQQGQATRAHKAPSYLINVPITVVFTPLPCSWRLENEGDEDGDGGLAVFTMRHERRTRLLRFDPWQIRDAFFRIHTTAQLGAFLHKTGVFSLHSDKFSDLVLWRSLFERLQTKSPSEWRNIEGFGRKLVAVLQARSVKATFDLKNGHPSATLHATATLPAIVASIQIDHIRKAKFRFCMRPGCGRPYEVESAHNRIYCSYACAHHQAVRMARERQHLARRGASV